MSPDGSAETFTPWTDESQVPRSVEALWKGADLQSEPLEVEIVDEWNEDGIVCRYVRYTVCTFEDVPCRVAAFYTFPEGGENLPAFVWAHGGGQRAERERGDYFARQGYAVLDINWGGREIVEGIKINTDWGTLDPTQGPQFYPGALRPRVKLDLEPDEHTIDAVPSPRNGNWFLLTYAARRGLTFLEQQAEVDGDKLGITGYSMGGNITVFSAIDPRIKAAIPMVGGTGGLTEDFPGLPGTAQAARFPNTGLFALTNDRAAYWPHIQCPVLILNATNDFHGIMERTYEGAHSLPHDQWRASYLLHYNHSLSPEQWALTNRWFDHFLKGTGKPLPPTPASEWEEDDDGIGTFTVRPEAIDRVASVEILYSHDPNPRSRFWKTAPADSTASDSWTARIPRRPELPLFIFAQCTYRLGEEVETFDGTTSTFTLTSDLHAEYPENIDAASLREKAQARKVFHDFSEDGLEGWSASLATRGLRTYRFQDPDRAVPSPETKLFCHFGQIEKPASFRLRLSRNEFLNNGEKKQTFVFAQQVRPGAEKLEISCSDFKEQGGEETLDSWEDVTHLTLEVLGVENGEHVHLAHQWAGDELQRMTWSLPEE